MKKRVTRKSSKATLLVYTFKREVDCFAFTALHTHAHVVSDSIQDGAECRK